MLVLVGIAHFFSVLFEESHTRTDTHKQAVSMQPNTMMFSPEDMFARFASSILSFNGRWFARADAACLVPSLGLEQILNVSLSLSAKMANMRYFNKTIVLSFNALSIRDTPDAYRSIRSSSLKCSNEMLIALS